MFNVEVFPDLKWTRALCSMLVNDVCIDENGGMMAQIAYLCYPRVAGELAVESAKFHVMYTCKVGQLFWSGVVIVKVPVIALRRFKVAGAGKGAFVHYMHCLLDSLTINHSACACSAFTDFGVCRLPECTREFGR